jgi:hypothetical protein
MFVFCSFWGFSQRKIKLNALSDKAELGLFLGGSYYLGDLNQFGQFKNTKPAFGLVFRKNFNPRFAFKMNGLYGQVQADDKQSGNKYQRVRNLNFRSKIIEASGQLEFNFLPFTIGDPETPFSPYLFAGLSIFNFNPQGLYNGQWVNLKDYSTEGQGLLPNRKNYANVQFAFPFGGGVKVSIHENLGIALEWGLRKTSTDYLDDVSTTYVSPQILKLVYGTDAVKISNPNYSSTSGYDITGYQRGNSTRKDLYSFAGVTLTFRFGTDKKCYFKSK